MNIDSGTTGRHRHPVAFLTHPRSGVLRGLGRKAALYAVTRHVRLPGVVNTLRHADRPDAVAAWLITVPLTPQELWPQGRYGGSRRALDMIERAVAQAQRLGARTVGLDTLLAQATAGGETLRHHSETSVCSGQAFTAAMTLLDVQRVLRLCPAGARVAVVGADGGVGGALTGLLARHSRQPLLLIGQDEDGLHTLTAPLEPGRAQISTCWSALRRADVVVLTPAADTTQLEARHLKAGAIVLDGPWPRQTRPDLLLLRPDVRIVDSGLVCVPGLCGPGHARPMGQIPAALAETLLLGLAGRQAHFGLGSPSAEQAEYLLGLARRYSSLGFAPAPPHSFGQPFNLDRRFEPPLTTPPLSGAGDVQVIPGQSLSISRLQLADMLTN